MGIKKSFSFDEQKEAEEIFRNGFPDKKLDYQKMYTIAKYFRETFGYGEIRLERELLRFCKEQDKNFNPITEQDTINKWIRAAMRYKLRKVTEIIITLSEVNLLKTIENKKERKILFTTLVLAKALKQKSKKNTDNFYIWYSDLLDIVHLSKISGLKETDVAKVFNTHKNLFTFYSAEKEGIRVNYADPGKDGEPVYSLNDIPLSYEMIFGTFCEKCKKPFLKNGNKQKYCKECAKEIIKEKDRNRKRLIPQIEVSDIIE